MVMGAKSNLNVGIGGVPNRMCCLLRSGYCERSCELLIVIGMHTNRDSVNTFVYFATVNLLKLNMLNSLLVIIFRSYSNNDVKIR